ncbi:MAG TPA: nucleotidyltransferase family protein [Verrucomicrobiae bacterium]|nr:nucleotidyltransferase family protein [Verrucomicrobiae bacterium]
MPPALPGNEPVRGFAFSTVILAAGFSRRMGQSKPLLQWEGTTVIAHVLQLWNDLGARRVMPVVRPDDSALASELDRLGVPRELRIVNHNAEHGMFSSIQAAARSSMSTASATHVVLTLIDQPHLNAEMIKPLLEFASLHSESICQPSYQGRGRHPLVFPAQLFAMLKHHAGPTLKEFMAEHAGRRSAVELNDPRLNEDIDTPEDYERLRQLCKK